MGEHALPISLDHERLTEFCRRYHIRRLALFGSVLRPDFGPDSDVDVLVEFEKDHTPGFALIRMERELSSLLGGRLVDLSVDEDVVWEVVTSDLPPLVAALERILGESR